MFLLEFSRCKLCHAQTERPEGGGYCSSCFHHWVLPALPVGSACYVCGERRAANLRWYQLQNARTVLCHNCVGVADRHPPRATDPDELLQRHGRDRRRVDRRTPGDPFLLAPHERRHASRRAA